MLCKRLRIDTWNIASNKNFSAIASRMAELDIDICAMQEVSFDPMVDLPAMFGHADRNASDYDWHFVPALTPDQQGGGRFDAAAALRRAGSKLPMAALSIARIAPSA